MATMPETFHPFGNGDAAARALADALADTLQHALATRARASLIVSGGSTPEPVYRRLSVTDLDWTRIDVVLADERWVEPGEEGSNADFICRTLLTGKAAQARFTGLKSPGARAADGLPATEARLAALHWPADCAVLGMGDDGHTLSWFPHADGLQDALSEDGPRVASITARQSVVTGMLTERITLTMRALEDLKLCALLIRGDAKRAALEKALLPGPVEDMPVRALLNHPLIDLQIFWSP
ncbi:6-phosphogluconolactonase [Glycocaulis abyssi]|uniref:6-phosphogluconolactonase n=1 Tax=Glycocaulis abyssi TaxID=1433403 RepID=A0ABV9N7D2_9PROT